MLAHPHGSPIARCVARTIRRHDFRKSRGCRPRNRFEVPVLCHRSNTEAVLTGRQAAQSEIAVFIRQRWGSQSPHKLRPVLRPCLFLVPWTNDRFASEGPALALALRQFRVLQEDTSVNRSEWLRDQIKTRNISAADFNTARLRHNPPGGRRVLVSRNVIVAVGKS